MVRKHQDLAAVAVVLATCRGTNTASTATSTAPAAAATAAAFAAAGGVRPTSLDELCQVVADAAELCLTRRLYSGGAAAQVRTPPASLIRRKHTEPTTHVLRGTDHRKYCSL